MQQNHLDNDVEFVGFVARPEPLIASLDVVVLPSILPEAFPTVTLEAMALGVAVASNLGGVVEQIDDECCGLLVPPADPDALAVAVKRLVSDPELRRRIGQAGRQRVASCFTMDRMVQQIHDAAKLC